MKKLKFKYLFILMAMSTGIKAQHTTNSPIYISGEKFTYPLIENWLNEYKKENPDSRLELTTKKLQNSKADVEINIITAEQIQNSTKNNVYFIARFSLLPITNAHNPLLTKIKKRGLNKTELDKLYFENASYEDEQENQSKKEPVLVVYSRENLAPSSLIFSRFFEHQSTELKGKKISGDDIFLLSAIKKDTLGLTFNSLGNIYDIKTRKLKEGIALLPLEIKNDEKKISGDIDQTIDFLENNDLNIVPVEELAISYPDNIENKAEIIKFISWVLRDGQKFNHEFGFLNVDRQTITSQLNQLTEYILSASNTY
jgi:ABC-type phosphate transport system substrate-binding protein